MADNVDDVVRALWLLVPADSYDWLWQLDPSVLPSRTIAKPAKPVPIADLTAPISRFSALAAKKDVSSAILPLFLLMDREECSTAAKDALLAFASRNAFDASVVAMIQSAASRNWDEAWASLSSVVTTTMSPLLFEVVFPMLRQLLGDYLNRTFSVSHQAKALEIITSRTDSMAYPNVALHTAFAVLERNHPSLFTLAQQLVTKVTSTWMSKDAGSSSFALFPSVHTIVSSALLSSRIITVNAAINTLKPLMTGLAKGLLPDVYVRVLLASTRFPHAHELLTGVKVSAKDAFSRLTNLVEHEQFPLTVAQLVKLDNGLVDDVVSWIISQFDAFHEESSKCVILASTLMEVRTVPFSDSTMEKLSQFLADRAFDHKDSVVRDGFLQTALSLFSAQPPSAAVVEYFANPIHEATESSQCNEFRLPPCARCAVSVISGLRPSESHDLVLSLADDLMVVFQFTENETVQLQLRDSFASVVRMLVDYGIDFSAHGIIEDLWYYLYLPTNQPAARRGVACGFAGFISGYGVRLIDEESLLSRFLEAFAKQKKKKAAKDAKEVTADPVLLKDAALAVCIALFRGLGSLLEPFLGAGFVEILVKAAADPNETIRNGADELATAMAKVLSPYGVDECLDCIEAAMSSDEANSWRSRVVLLSLMGKLAPLAPKVAAPRLPRIVPVLLDCLVDAQTDIQVAAETALERLGGVARTPELHMLIPSLVRVYRNRGHGDDGESISRALSGVIQTRFNHRLDSASTSLLMPLIAYALRHGVSSNDVGTIVHASLVLSAVPQLVSDGAIQTFVTDLVTVLQQLERALFDVVPECRAAAARAVGSVARHALAKDVGETIFFGMRDSMIDRMRKPTTGYVERVASAQCVAELVGDEKFLPIVSKEIVPWTGSKVKAAAVPASAREAFLSCISHLPRFLHTAHASELSNACFASAIAATSDASDVVKRAAGKACEEFVTEFVPDAPEFVMVALKACLLDKDEKLRHAGLQYLGDVFRSSAAATHRAGQRDVPGRDAQMNGLMELAARLLSKGEDSSVDIETESPGDGSGEGTDKGMVWVGKERYEKIKEADVRKALGDKYVDELLAILFTLTQDTVNKVRNDAALLWRCIIRDTIFALQRLMRCFLPIIADEFVGHAETYRQQLGRPAVLELFKVAPQHFNTEMAKLGAAGGRDVALQRFAKLVS